MTPSTQFEPSDASRGRSGADSAVLLRVEGIRAGYGKKEILHGVDLEVKAGEIIVLAGANGAGKSTFLKVVAGLLKPTAGTVQLDGKDVTSLPAHRRTRLGVGYLLQGGEVFPSLTVEENLSTASGHDSLDPESVEPVLSLFPPLRQMLQRRAGLLSGGERQMLALAMVLVRQPRLLLLDEPTAALAPSIASETLHKVSEFCQQQGIGAVLVEQRLREALAFSDRALALVLGRVEMETRDPHQWADSVDLHSRLLPNPNDRNGVWDSEQSRSSQQGL
jgi:ABC-type branched-subunit amino acid transport system ATPase component